MDFKNMAAKNMMNENYIIQNLDFNHNPERFF